MTSVNDSTKPLEDQILYKLGSVEALVINGMRRIDEQLAVLVKTMASHQAENSIELKDVKDRVTKLETWRTYSKARIAGILAVVSVIWAIWARDIQAFINGPLS